MVQFLHVVCWNTIHDKNDDLRPQDPPTTLQDR
jgi:hypothetical protein